MKMKKTLITTTLALTLALSSFTGVFALADPVNDKNVTCEIKMDYTFKDFKVGLKDNLTVAQVKKAEQLFNKGTELDEKVNSYWQDLDKLNIYKEYKYDADDNMGWDKVDEEYAKEAKKEFLELLKKDLSKSEKAEAEKLYDKLIDIEKDGKFEETTKIWDELYKDYLNINFSGENTVDNVDYDKEMEAVELTFDDFQKDFKESVSKETKTKAKKLFDEMMVFENKGDFEKSWEKMDEIINLNVFDDKLYEAIGDNDVIDSEEPWSETCNIVDGDNVIGNDQGYEAKELTFEDFAKEFKDNASKEDMSKAKVIFEKITKTQKEALKVWDELYSMDIFK